jgi:hypothetical protein
MSEQPSYPRYFAYGQAYLPPAPYIQAIDAHASFIVDPIGTLLHAFKHVGYWENRANEGAMIEVTQDLIVAAIERWNQFNRPKLRLPD